MTALDKRISAIDILRGIVMIIMALDHCRDFFFAKGLYRDPMDPETTYFFLYFTRWITHFCAPVFVFLSGISAYLSAQNKSPKQVSNFLIKRGLWLIIVEIVIISFALTFDIFYHVIILQIIWAIGCSMIILGFLSRYPRLVLAIGLILFFGHNALNYLSLPGPDTYIGRIIFVSTTSTAAFLPIGDGRLLGVFYTILPWTGAMLLGFSAGQLYKPAFNPARRKQILFYSGLGLFCLFLLLRFFNAYGEPVPRKEYTDLIKTLFSFFNVSKYPPSLQFFGMTLGPALMLLPALENLKNKYSDIIAVYGKAPLFYYVIHFYLIHICMLIFFMLNGYSFKEITSPIDDLLPQSVSMGYSLPVVYLIWLSIVAILYQPCKWFIQYKRTHQHWWLKYI